MPLSTYTRLTNLISIRDVMTPIQGVIPASATLQEAIDLADSFGVGDSGLPYLVGSGDELIGSVSYWDIREAIEIGVGNTMDERVVRPINPNLIVTADTPLWRATALLMRAAGDLDIWFVIDGHEVVGTLTYRDLFKPPFRLCLLAMTFELEQLSLRLCQRNAKTNWSALTEGRQQNAEKAMRRAQERREPTRASERVNHLRAHPALLLEYTTFIDKKTILIKRGLLPSIRRDVITETFDSAEELRNRCAHPDSGDEAFIDDPKELLRNVQACHVVLAKIKDVLERKEAETGPEAE